MAEKVPTGCGEGLSDPIYYNAQQQEFLRIRRLRFCLNCKKIGSMNDKGGFVCERCHTVHTSRATAPRVFHTMGLFAGRQGGKTQIAAIAAREEVLVPKSVGWIMGATYKILHDSTFPTFVRLIPPQWVADWDKEHMEITFVNGAKVAFRSLDDPERARGPHVDWGWLDEAALAAERAWHVFQPTLATTGGAAILSTSPAGFDWTYEQVWKPARIRQLPGFWAAKYKTLENPIFTANPELVKQIEQKRLTMSPELFRQEYEADFVNFQGAIYGYELIMGRVLDDAAIKKHIPEWPAIDRSRPVVVGLDSGADHPFGAVLLVSTPTGLVAVGEYLERLQAVSQQIRPIKQALNLYGFSNVTWAANKNEKNLRLEFGLPPHNIGVVPAENSHEIGIQRTQSWLYGQQLFFAESRVPRLIEQMKAYRYAENTHSDGSKKAREDVFKKDDELPDALRYAIMAWPELPKEVTVAQTDEERARWDAMPEKVKQEIARSREYKQRLIDGDTEPMAAGSSPFAIGDFFGNAESGRDTWATAYGG